MSEVQGLLELSKKYPIIDIRGRGLMVAVEFGEQRSVDGSYTAKSGCAAAVTKAAQKRNMILLTAGQLPLSMVVMSDVFSGRSRAYFGCAFLCITGFWTHTCQCLNHNTMARCWAQVCQSMRKVNHDIIYLGQTTCKQGLLVHLQVQESASGSFHP